jgi:hypothetical protein
MMTRRTYRIRGTLWKQEQLTYDEFETIWKLTRGHFAGLDFADPKGGLADWIDRSIEKRILPRIAAVILKPHEPTPLHKLWNRWAARRSGIKPEDLGTVISASPVLGEIVRDFFMLNVGWIDVWLNTQPNFRSNGKGTATPAETLSTLMNIVSTFAMATSEARSILETSRPKPS